MDKVYFKKDEFKCRHCGENKFDAMYVFKFLNGLRNSVGKPIIITSGYRCPVHNKEIGGSPHSTHVKGIAVDFYIKGVDWNAQKAIVVNAWIKYILLKGIPLRLGIYEDKKFFHIDEKAVYMLGNDSVMWVKDEKGYHYGEFRRKEFEEGMSVDYLWWRRNG